MGMISRRPTIHNAVRRRGVITKPKVLRNSPFTPHSKPGDTRNFRTRRKCLTKTWPTVGRRGFVTMSFKEYGKLESREEVVHKRRGKGLGAATFPSIIYGGTRNG